jgi:hypothetical protein
MHVRRVTMMIANCVRREGEVFSFLGPVAEETARHSTIAIDNSIIYALPYRHHRYHGISPPAERGFFQKSVPARIEVKAYKETRETLHMKSEIARLCVAFEKDSSLSLPACLLNNITSPPDCVEGATEEIEKISSCLLCETVWLWRICAAAFLTCTIDPLQTGREPARRRPLHTRGLGQGPRRCTQLPNRGGC